jgi:serine/threonine protein kinase
MNDTRTALPRSGLLADLVDLLSARAQAGEVLDAEVLAAEYPEFAEDLRRLLPALGLLGELSRSRQSLGAGASPVGDLGGVLGDFRLVREVGRGGMGVVYEAEQISLRRRVALKVLPFAAVLDPRHLQRFRNEALAAASLDHPHVVKVYGVGCERGVHFIAMQFIDGRTLAELVRERRDGTRGVTAGSSQDPTLPYAPDATDVPPATERPTGATSRTPADVAYVRRVAGWGVDAAAALEHAHELGVVHRDVKPGNLLVDGAGKVYVADFGLAKVSADPGMTATGDVLGTVRYMSPEQALARHDLVDHRSDVYSLGVTLYELLTLTPAFEGKDRQELLSKVASAEAVALRNLDRSIPRDLETVVQKAMEKDPARRYQSAKELADDLRRFLADEPVHAKRPTLLDRLGKWTRRHRAVAWSGVVLLAVTAAVFAAAAVLVWDEKNAKELALKDKTDALADREKALGEKDAALTAKESALTEKSAALAQRDLALARSDRHLRGSLDAARNLLAIGAEFSRAGGGDRADDAMVAGIRVFEQVVADYPDRLHDRESLADICQATGDSLFLRGKLERALSVYQKQLGAWLGIRADFPNYDRQKSAGAYPLTASQIALSHARVGDCLAGLGRLAEAAASYRAALAAWDEVAAKANPVLREFYDGERAMLLANLGVVASERGQAPEAEEAFRRALEMAGGTKVLAPAAILHTARAGRAELLWSLGRTREAEAAYREVIAGASGRNRVLLLATCPVAELRDADKAVELAKPLVAGPNPDAANWRVFAAAHARAGNRKEAEEAVGRAGGGQAPELFLLAMLCHKQGDGKAAAQWYFRGAGWMNRNNPHDLVAHRLRAEAAELLGIATAPPPRPKPAP